MSNTDARLMHISDLSLTMMQESLELVACLCVFMMPCQALDVAEKSINSMFGGHKPRPHVRLNACGELSVHWGSTGGLTVNLQGCVEAP